MMGDVRIALACCLVACGRVDFAPVDPDATPDATADAAPTGPGGFTFSDFPDCSQLVLLASAGCVGGELEITPSLMNARGAAWLRKTYDMTTLNHLAMELRVRMVVGSADSGDGMVVSFQADPRGTGAIGAIGGQLGFGAITPSAAVELDTFTNLEFVPPETSNNHVGVDVDGEVISTITATPGFPMVQTSIFSVWIDYRASDHTLAVALDPSTTKPATPLFSTTQDLARLGTAAYLGVTGSTGNSFVLQHVISWSLATD
jgi:hypothetical protein